DGGRGLIRKMVVGGAAVRRLISHLSMSFKAPLDPDAAVAPGAFRRRCGRPAFDRSVFLNATPLFEEGHIGAFRIVRVHSSLKLHRSCSRPRFSPDDDPIDTVQAQGTQRAKQWLKRKGTSRQRPSFEDGQS